MLIYRGSFSILHECGGDPDKVDQAVKTMQVFSTSVEVILKIIKEGTPNIGILHECGGDPNFFLRHVLKSMYSPHMWR